MFYAIIQRPDQEPEATLYFSYERFAADMFPALNENPVCINFAVHGKTYAERQASVRDLAIEWQLADSEYDGAGLSMMEYSVICDWFCMNARRYGLLREFRENGIC